MSRDLFDTKPSWIRAFYLPKWPLKSVSYRGGESVVASTLKALPVKNDSSKNNSRMDRPIKKGRRC